MIVCPISIRCGNVRITLDEDIRGGSSRVDLFLEDQIPLKADYAGRTAYSGSQV